VGEVNKIYMELVGNDLEVVMNHEDKGKAPTGRKSI
jgi:hypothetical protein